MSKFSEEYYKLKEKKLNKYYMNIAIEEANNSDGGPFGAVIIKNKEIISKGNNKVTILNDPTAYAEIVAIRNACNKLNTFTLEDCVLYTSCEPCPMCLSAIYWSRINTVYFANTCSDAASINFDDKEIYEELLKKIDERKINMYHINDTNAYDTFTKWKNNTDKINY